MSSVFCDIVDGTLLLVKDSLSILISEFKKVRHGHFVEPFRESCFSISAFSFPFNWRFVKVSIESDGWRTQLMFRGTRSFSLVKMDVSL